MKGSGLKYGCKSQSPNPRLTLSLPFRRGESWAIDCEKSSMHNRTMIVKDAPLAE